MTLLVRNRIRYVAVDLVTTSVALLLFNVARYDLDRTARLFSSLEAYLTNGAVMWEQILFPPLMLALYWLSGYYNEVLLKSRLQELSTTLANALIGTTIFFLVALINDPQPRRRLTYMLILLMFGLTFVLLYAGRFVITSSIRRKVRTGHYLLNTLIIGTGSAAYAMARRIGRAQSVMGLRVVGIVDINTPPAAASGCGIAVYGMDAIEKLAEQLDIKKFVVMPQSDGPEATKRIINRLLPLGRGVLVSPDVYQLFSTRFRTANIAGEPLVDVAHAHISPITANLKRVCDVVGGIVGLILSLPIVAAAAVFIKLDSPGPVIYRQLRLGRNKKPFTLYKLRTMTADAEPNGPMLTSRDDPRVTRVGRVLRKYRLDELPQFLCVIVGDMSLVGPRPEREHFVNQLMAREPSYTLVQQVRPGLTSWGMVKYGYASTIDDMVERLRYELLYLENLSIRIDIKIIIYTIKIIITGKGL